MRTLGEDKAPRGAPEAAAAPPEPGAAAPGQEEAGGQPEEEIAQLRRELEGKNQEFEELHRRYLRLAADFENFRRRTSQELADQRQQAAARLLTNLLPVLDNFELALASARAVLPDNVVTGIDMIYRQFWGVLTQEGLQPIDAVGKPFDPAYHEAFEHVETEEHPDGTVISEVQKGYTLHGRVLRPALVRVAKAPVLPESREEKEVGEGEQGHRN